MSLPPSTQNRRILIIDDTAAIHEDFRKILASDSTSSQDLVAAEAALFGDTSPAQAMSTYELESAFQGQEALERVKASVETGRLFALAFVDVRMPPGWDGIETIERLWEVDPRLQVVVCTAFSDYSWDEMIEKLGETDRLLLLKKPFDHIEVRQFAVALCAKWNSALCADSALANLEELVEARTRKILAQKTELEQTHAQLLQAQKLESIGQLAAGIAHEINTPIQYVGDNIRFFQENVTNLFTILDRYSDLIDPEGTSSVWAERVATIHTLIEELDLEFLKEEIPAAIQQSLEGVERVAKIVQSMKEFSHPGGDEKQLVDLNHAIETTISVARNEWKYVSEMKTEFAPDLPMVPCFIGDLNQVILNMIVNAAHAITDVIGEGSEKKGTITITTQSECDWVSISIKDTGAGIPDDIQSKIFNPFFTTKEVGKGTGQGLAIAQTTIRKHGGALTVESTPGCGAEFTIRLPLDEPQESSVNEDENETAHSIR